MQRRWTILAGALVGAAVAVLGITTTGSRAAPSHELPRSPSWQQGNFAALVPRTTYHAGLVDPAPSIRASNGGWNGTQIVTRRHGKVAYEIAVFLGHQTEIDLLTGPALTLSPAAALAAPRTRIGVWDFSPYDPPTAVGHQLVSGRRALYFDATAPPPGLWTVVGRNPPELQVEHDHSFRMLALSVRGQTVVIVIQTEARKLESSLPAAQRLLASLRFAP
jgi:hypothetical protein